MSQKKTLEINPRHPLIKELLKRVSEDKEDAAAQNMANLMYETATLRSGFMLQDTATFASRVEQLLRQSLGVSESALVEEDEDLDGVDDPVAADSSAADDTKDNIDAEDDDQKNPDDDAHDEL